MVLASGAELERGLFFLDVENIGVNLEEFRKVASWVSGTELSDHVAEVVFVLLDDQGQGRWDNISQNEFLIFLIFHFTESSKKILDLCCMIGDSQEDMTKVLFTFNLGI